MSTIYTDGAGNKYLGDCIYANHDLSYPSTNFLLCNGTINTRTPTTFLSDINTFASAVGYSSIYVNPSPSWGTALNTTIFSFSTASPSVSIRFHNPSAGDGGWDNTISVGGVISTSYIGFVSGNLQSQTNFNYCFTGNQNHFASLIYKYNSTYSGIVNPYSYFRFAGKLVDINTQLGYYSGSPANHCIAIRGIAGNLNIPAVDRATHYIVSAEKSLLTSGRAAYTITCSDGQTPGAQWATDMWVFDNNATLGFPVIGRVPNMLLGIGSYTYLKPVKIQGTVFPDAGSPWYVPVGTFAGKTLLMRCYSSISL